jgi:membrane-associated protease RseP (regulator of RpoE activity)
MSDDQEMRRDYSGYKADFRQYPPWMAEPPEPDPQFRFPWLNIILFVLTVFSTMFFGAYMAHYSPDWHKFWIMLKYHPAIWLDGLPFSITLMVILLSHELAHYFFSRHHKVPSSLPYFIPAPNLIGTFGAVIFMKGRITDRRALLDIGAAGPLAGFIVSLFALYVGVKYAKIVPFDASEGLIMFMPNQLIDWAFRLWLPAAAVAPSDVIQSPILDAAWVGFFVTMLNLLPIGQLDGGHVAYAALGKYTIYLSWAVIAVLFAMGGISILADNLMHTGIFWEGWLFFAIFSLILMGPRGVRHPPPLRPEIKLDWFRWLVVIIVVIVFFLTFTPTPFVVTG